MPSDAQPLPRRSGWPPPTLRPLSSTGSKSSVSRGWNALVFTSYARAWGAVDGGILEFNVQGFHAMPSAPLDSDLGRELSRSGDRQPRNPTRSHDWRQGGPMLVANPLQGVPCSWRATLCQPQLHRWRTRPCLDPTASAARRPSCAVGGPVERLAGSGLGSCGRARSGCARQALAQATSTSNLGLRCSSPVEGGMLGACAARPDDRGKRRRRRRRRFGSFSQAPGTSTERGGP